MPATQISFAAFAATFLASVQSEAIESTPPVQQAAIEVVAHPLAVDGGECPRFDGVWEPQRGVTYFDTRRDWDWSVGPDWACGGLDAPAYLPAGSHSSFENGVGGPFLADRYADARLGTWS